MCCSVYEIHADSMHELWDGGFLGVLRFYKLGFRLGINFPDFRMGITLGIFQVSRGDRLRRFFRSDVFLNVNSSSVGILMVLFLDCYDLSCSSFHSNDRMAMAIVDICSTT